MLLAESRKQLEQWQNDGQSERNLNLSIPLLMQNKAPEGFEDGNRVRVDLRPESVSRFSSQVLRGRNSGLKMWFTLNVGLSYLLKCTRQLRLTAK